MIGRPRPSLDDIRILPGFFMDVDVQLLDAREFQALSQLVFAIAAAQVWTYTEPQDDPSLPDDDNRLGRLCRIPVRRFRSMRPTLAQFFSIRDGCWRLERDWIEIIRPDLRVQLSATVRAAVFERDGHRCCYCGTTEGPLEIDHVVPVSRGGTNDLTNLATACQSCNRSKRNMTLEEWRGSR